MRGFGDLALVGLLIISFVISDAIGAHYAVYAVIMFIVLKYWFIDLRQYKNGEDIKGALGLQLRQMEKIGGRGFALGLALFISALMFVVSTIMFFWSLVR